MAGRTGSEAVTDTLINAEAETLATLIHGEPPAVATQIIAGALRIAEMRGEMAGMRHVSAQIDRVLGAPTRVIAE